MAGGMDQGTFYDSGTVSVRVSGAQASVDWSEGSTVSGLASELAAAINTSAGGRWQLDGTVQFALANPPGERCAYIWDLGAERAGESRIELQGHESDIAYFDFVGGEKALITTELYQ
jgi:hypothetical protein